MKIFNEEINHEEIDLNDSPEFLLENFWKIYKTGTVKEKRKAREALKRAGIIYFFDARYGVIIGRKGKTINAKNKLDK